MGSDSVVRPIILPSHGNDQGSNPCRSTPFPTPSCGFGLRRPAVFDSTLRSSNFEGFTHNHAAFRFSRFAGLSGSQVSHEISVQSGDSGICSGLRDSQEWCGNLEEFATVAADKGYDWEEIRTRLRAESITPLIPQRDPGMRGWAMNLLIKDRASHQRSNLNQWFFSADCSNCSASVRNDVTGSEQRFAIEIPSSTASDRQFVNRVT